LAIILIGCNNDNSDLSDDTSQVVFSFSNPDEVPDDIIFVEMNSDTPVLKHVPAVESGNSIKLDKSSVHLIGFTGIPDSARSISSQISVLGSLSVVKIGLNSLPLSEEASSVVDLGDVSKSDDSFESNIDDSSVSDDTGYDSSTLSDFGKYDEVLSKFLNPDVNSNGIYDSDENLIWQFRVDYFY